jgi:hypothetical protein
MSKKQKFLVIFVFLGLTTLLVGFQNCSQMGGAGLSNLDLSDDIGNDGGPDDSNPSVIVTSNFNCSPSCSGNSCQFHTTQAFYVCVYNVIEGTSYGFSGAVAQSGIIGSLQGWTEGANVFEKVFSGFPVGTVTINVYSNPVAHPVTFTVVQ